MGQPPTLGIFRAKGWTSPLFQATAASYNFGLGNISGNPNTINIGTTKNNYGSNVEQLMACFGNN